MSSDDDSADEGKRARKGKGKARKAEYTSAAFINSNDEPTSQPPDGVEEEAEPPRKRQKSATEGKSAKTKTKKDKKPAPVLYNGTEKQEAEIAKLKDVCKAAGLRIPQKALSELKAPEVIARLTQQLQEAGLEKPFSLAKAKTHREETELAREVQSLGKVGQGSSRGKRRSGIEASHIIKGAAQKRNEEDEDGSEMDEESEKLKDKRSNKAVSSFLQALARVAE